MSSLFLTRKNSREKSRSERKTSPHKTALAFKKVEKLHYMPRSSSFRIPFLVSSAVPAAGSVSHTLTYI